MPANVKGKAQSVLTDLHTLVDEVVHKMSYEKTFELAEEASRIADEEQELYFKVIAKLMGQENKPNKDPDDGAKMEAFDRVRWLPLRPSTRKRKTRLRGAAFRNIKWLSGESTALGRIPLKSYLRQLTISNRKSEYRIFKVSRDTSKHDRYRIYLTPSLADRVYDFGHSMSGIFDEEQEFKVNARNRYTGLSNEEARPIFRPVMEYFVVQRIPRRINQELRKRGYSVTRFA